MTTSIMVLKSRSSRGATSVNPPFLFPPERLFHVVHDVLHQRAGGFGAGEAEGPAIGGALAADHEAGAGAGQAAGAAGLVVAAGADAAQLASRASSSASSTIGRRRRHWAAGGPSPTSGQIAAFRFRIEQGSGCS